MRDFPKRVAPLPLQRQSGIRRATVTPIGARLGALLGQDLFQTFRSALMARFAKPRQEKPDDQ